MIVFARVDLEVELLDVRKPKHRRGSFAESKGAKMSKGGQARGRIEKKAIAGKIVDVKAASLKARRDQALDATFGLLKGKGVLSEDALQFEREMREE